MQRERESKRKPKEETKDGLRSFSDDEKKWMEEDQSETKIKTQ